MRRFSIFHETLYNFDNQVVLGPHKLLIRPREGHDVRIERSSLTITPDATVKWHRDELDNSVAITRFNEPSKQLRIVSQVIIEHYDEWPLDFLVDDYAVQYPFAYENEEHIALSPYLRTSPWIDQDLFRNWMSRFNQSESVETYALLSKISEAIASEHQYRIREEPGVQSPIETLSAGSGSCRDYAWLFMCTARQLGLAARFVSGYLHMQSAENADGATHAWAEVYLPGAGWKGFDPTSKQVTGCHHIPTAVSILPESVPPVSGHFTGPAGERPTLSVCVNVKSVQH